MVEYKFIVCVCVCAPRQTKEKSEGKKRHTTKTLINVALPAIWESYNANTCNRRWLNEVIFWFIKRQTVNLTIFIHLNYGSNQVISIKALAVLQFVSIRFSLDLMAIACELYHPMYTIYTFLHCSNKNVTFFSPVLHRLFFVALPIEHLLLRFCCCIQYSIRSFIHIINVWLILAQEMLIFWWELFFLSSKDINMLGGI